MKKLFLIPLVMLFSCQKESKIVDNTLIKNDSAAIQVDSADIHGSGTPNEINLGIFKFPAEVNGCSCYFSKNKEDFDQEKYIYIDDYGNTAYVKIDDKMVKIPMKEGDFDPENFSKTIKNDDVTITIDGKKIKEMEEVMMFEGTMTVENKKGEKTITSIYGECGC